MVISITKFSLDGWCGRTFKWSIFFMLYHDIVWCTYNAAIRITWELLFTSLAGSNVSFYKHQLKRCGRWRKYRCLLVWNTWTHMWRIPWNCGYWRENSRATVWLTLCITSAWYQLGSLGHLHTITRSRLRHRILHTALHHVHVEHVTHPQEAWYISTKLESPTVCTLILVWIQQPSRAK